MLIKVTSVTKSLDEAETLVYKYFNRRILVYCEVLNALITQPEEATSSTWRTRSEATTTHVTLAYARLIRAQSLGDTKYTTFTIFASLA